jgi:hypothetical protein
MGPALLVLIAAFTRQALAGSVKKSFSNNEFVVHFPDSSQESCDVIMHAVGTFTSADKYANFSQALVRRGYVVVIVDPQKGNPTKLDSEKSKEAFEFAKSYLPSWFSTCGRFNKWILGGHSAGGGTAHAVIAANPSLADAVFSMDPFDLSSNGGNAVISKPALYWGFDFTSCFVTKEKSALMAFDNTDNERRVFVRVQKETIWTGLGWGPKIFHCSHVDGHCTACGSRLPTPPELFEDIANTVDQFVKDAFTRTWNPKVIEVKTSVPVEMFHSRQMSVSSCPEEQTDFAAEKLIKDLASLR